MCKEIGIAIPQCYLHILFILIFQCLMKNIFKKFIKEKKKQTSWQHDPLENNFLNNFAK